MDGDTVNETREGEAEIETTFRATSFGTGEDEGAKRFVLRGDLMRNGKVEGRTAAKEINMAGRGCCV